MPFELPPLPHDRTALEPHLPADTVDQRRREQQAHLDAVNAAIADGPLAEASVELPEAKGHPGVHLLAARLRPRLPQGTPGAAHRIVLNLP